MKEIRINLNKEISMKWV